MNKSPSILFTKGFRDAELAKALIEKIKQMTTRPWSIMEICGGQTHAIMQYGLDHLLPSEIELLHGPGCPVCVTPLELIDKAVAIASLPGVIFTSFGDMLRVPGSNMDLFSVRASGGQVRVVYSPLDAVRIAQENPDKQVVFFAIGFETTAPVNASSVIMAKELGLKNFSLLVSQVTVPAAIYTIMESQNCKVNGFLAAGHVCAVMGYWEYTPIVEKYHIPVVVTGFEPLDLINGIYSIIKQLEEAKAETYNAYSRAVTYQGNRSAQALINKVFRPCDRKWRGIGMIPMSGLCLNDEYNEFDAEARFQINEIKTEESPLCIAGLILQGLKKPSDCPAFGKICTPDNPLGATMVSSEGACAAYYRYNIEAVRNQS